jgi:hypothetical protein
MQRLCVEILASRPSDPVFNPPAKRKANASERVRESARTMIQS